MKGEIEDVDGCPGDEEDEADQNQCCVCLFAPGYLPGSTECSETSWRMRGGKREANSGVEKSDNYTWEEELHNNGYKSVGEVIKVRLPFLPRI